MSAHQQRFDPKLFVEIRGFKNAKNESYFWNSFSKTFFNLDFFKADEIIIKNLSEQKNLLGSGSLVHSYPHSWRSKAPLVHRATPQWFISMESHGLRKKALKSIDETNFYPNKGKERLRSMIELRPDWCVSRQRVWGVPIPVFMSKKTKCCGLFYLLCLFGHLIY